MGKQDPWYGRNVYCMTKSYCRTFPSTIPSITIPICKKQAKTTLLSPKSIGKQDEARRRSLSSDTVMAEMQRMLLLSRAGGSTAGILRPNVAAKFTSRKPKRSAFTNPYSPRHIFRHEIENYYREAKHISKLKAYCCECWFSESIQSDLVVPFLLYAELGSEVEAVRSFFS